MKFVNIITAFAYWNLFLLVLSGESLLLVSVIGCLFTLLMIFIRKGLYHHWIVGRK